MAPRETGPRDGRRVEGWAWRHRAHARTSASALIFCAELFVPSADLQAIHMKRLGARHPMIAGKIDRKSTRLNSSHLVISYAVFCLKKKNIKMRSTTAGGESLNL